MFCTNCGKEIPDGSHNCMYCGAAVADSSNVTDATEVMNTVPETVDNISETVEATNNGIGEKIEVNNEVKIEVINEVKTEVTTEAVAEESSEANAVEPVEEKTEEKTEENTVTMSAESTVSDNTVSDNTVSDNSVPVSQPIPQPVPAPQPMPQPMPGPVAPSAVDKSEPKKKGGAGIVVAILVIVLILAGAGIAAFLILNSPDTKIKKAANNGEVATVCELYPDVNNSEVKLYVQNVMFNYACDLEEQFKADSIEYEDMKKDLDALSKNVLKGDKEFKALVEDMEVLNESKENYAAAEDYYKDGDYKSAYEKYSLVIKDDSNYKKAQKKMDECAELMIPNIVGAWKYDCDMGDYILAELEADGMGYNIKCPVSLWLEFDEDGTGKMYIDEDSLKDGLDSAMSDIVDIMYDILEQEFNMTRAELDAYFLELSGLTLKEMVEDDLDVNELFDDSQLKAEFTYIVEDGVIICTGESKDDFDSEIEFYMEGDYMVITGDSAGVFENFEDYGIYTPVYFLGQ